MWEAHVNKHVICKQPKIWEAEWLQSKKLQTKKKKHKSKIKKRRKQKAEISKSRLKNQCRRQAPFKLAAQTHVAHMHIELLLPLLEFGRFVGSLFVWLVNGCWCQRKSDRISAAFFGNTHNGLKNKSSTVPQISKKKKEFKNKITTATSLEKSADCRCWH